MEKTIFILAMTFVLASLGCSTIYFHQGSNKDTSVDHDEWHHDGILRLVEFSPPVDMANRCEGKNWSNIKVEKSFLNGLATILRRIRLRSAIATAFLASVWPMI